MGCSIAQLCPCAGPRGTTARWRHHLEYVACVGHAALDFLRADLIDWREAFETVAEAVDSGCGRRS